MEWYEIVLYSIASIAFIVIAVLTAIGIVYGGSVPPPPIKSNGATMKQKNDSNKKTTLEYIALIVLVAVIVALTLFVLSVSSAHAQELCPPDAECEAEIVEVIEWDGCPEPGTPQCKPLQPEAPPVNQEDIPCGELHSLCIGYYFEEDENGNGQWQEYEKEKRQPPQEYEEAEEVESLPCDDFWLVTNI